MNPTLLVLTLLALTFYTVIDAITITELPGGSQFIAERQNLINEKFPEFEPQLPTYVNGRLLQPPTCFTQSSILPYIFPTPDLPERYLVGTLRYPRTFCVPPSPNA
eukprot:TRINITY_DN53_c0_g1_i1.p1 TRINITY_DN53_c0_g1~~TRINITY_DN53_c0_g1_i1.p1  ORF type:complete len:106 (+),score=12.51 TRINITY_DN53_c0_g1_i1:54-371(+)